MKKDEMEEFLKNFADNFEELYNGFEKSRKCCKEKHEEEDDDDDEEQCEYAESLKKDYNECHEWAFGGEIAITNKVQGRNLWEKLHPDLPVPRILKTQVSTSDKFGTIGMLMDVYPLYLKYKESKRK